MVWIGVDPGEKRVGVARSDPLGMFASPDQILGSAKELASYLQELEAEGRLEGAIVGLPRNMNGTMGPIGDRSLRLVAQLRSQLEAPVYLFDERLSTQQARRMQPDAQHVDDRVAALLLQAFLDSGKRPPPDPPELADVAPE